MYLVFYWAFGSLNCHPQLVGSESALITGTVTAPCNCRHKLTPVYRVDGAQLLLTVKKKKKSLQHSKIGRNWDWLQSFSGFLKVLGMGGEQVGGWEEGRMIQCLASWRRIRMEGWIMGCGS